VQKAASLYLRKDSAEKRKLLEIVYSNSQVKDMELIPSYRKPFDIIMDTKGRRRVRLALL
jgi:hypothetical protein